ncbi:hypothetical protein BN59_03613 [Legionella massiliensis]|uniref:Uncharacterized protein n=1 Tax=Legionella massiliensis TaxID=1034943 RepID=A0A078KY05_9GAMM|nr:hypothetical protein [Legionella massiliensis]CDZ79295.1 hypothetical protein BN59_03613 [Legionella massiliensis]CEE15033.1 hypothetical protein BN1094_03613 [Legionella massiliensis]
MPAFKFETKKATFHISGEKLIIAPKQTYLKTRGLDENGEYYIKTEYFIYPEASIVNKNLNQLGYPSTKMSIDGKEHFSFKNKGEITPELARMFIAICVIQDLVPRSDGVKFLEDFISYTKDAANAENFYVFFADKAETTDKQPPCLSGEQSAKCS